MELKIAVVMPILAGEAYSAACEAHSHEFCFINVEAVRASPNRAGVCKIPGYDPTK